MFWQTRDFITLLINSRAFHLILPELKWDNKSTLNGLEEYFKIHLLLQIMQFQGEVLGVTEVKVVQRAERDDVVWQNT